MTSEWKSEIEKKVLANALEVYIQTLRGMSIETAFKCRPYKANANEEELASDLSIDSDVCSQEKEAV